jgi:hydrogenase maturation protein HypF
MRERRRVHVRGVVQGVGFRPFVFRFAARHALGGWVRNGRAGVTIEVEGAPDVLERFLDTLRRSAPPAAVIEHLEVRTIEPRGDADFTIVTSNGSEPIEPTLPPDLAVCTACLAEVRDPEARRHRYPFTNCTSCGPRYSIIERLPYDRPNTAMRRFPMCDACASEYQEPADRRFHAQPIACPRCGPKLSLTDSDGRVQASGPAAFDAAVQALEGGEILGLKGLGGFQLLADAESPSAVRTLRRRKRRPTKPFAVVFPSLQAARRHLEISPAEAAALSSPAAPILLLRKKTDGGVADAVAPGNPCLGVMLPYTPLHATLAEALGRPFVCTSGNRSDEPMCIRTEEVVERLGGVVDRILTHDRDIVRPVDDSVARLDGDRMVLLRRARGYAPTALRLGVALPRIFAVGGHLKSTVALGLGDRVVVSQHLGDLDGPEGLDLFDATVEDLVTFLAFKPEAVACDAHPDYASTGRARSWAERWKVPLIPVQHHHAHVAACAAEHGVTEPLLGFSWDGTGYGGDGTVWGGEALRCVGGTFTRVAHLRTFPLPGGDRAVIEPRRAALGLLHALDPDRAAAWTAAWFQPPERDVLCQMIEGEINAPLTSSVGRLFDAVAAILGLKADAVSFEGEAAMALEFAARGEAVPSGGYPLPLGGEDPAVADWRPFIEAVIADRDRGVDPREISARVHGGLADHVVEVACAAGIEGVALTGGCFQNRILTRAARARLEAAGFRVYTHSRIPPGDGGLSLGQVWVAGFRMMESGPHPHEE